MALVLEAVSVSGVVQRVPVKADRIKVTAQQGFTYKLVDDAGAPFDKTIAVKRMRNSLVIDGLPQDQVVELDGFFFNCVPSAPCTFVTANVGGAAPVTPASEPVGALQDGSFLMFGKGEITQIPTIVPESEFSARPLLIGGGALALIGLAAGGGGGGGSGGGGGGGGASDTTPPAAPVLSSGTATKEGKPILSGTAEAGATVLIGIDIDGNGTPDVSYRTVADANGVWSVNLATDAPSALTLPASGLPEGTVAVTMRAVDAAGNTSTTATSFNLQVDKTAPTQTATISKISDDQTGGIVGDIATGGASNDPTPTLTGTVSTALADGDRVQILRGGTVAGFATLTGTVWTFTDTLPAGAVASIEYRAQVTDAVGNVAPASAAFTVAVDTVAPVVPTIAIVAGDNIVNAAEAAAPITLSGTAEAGSLVGISWGGKNFSTTATSAGAWQQVIAAADVPGNGVRPVVVTATDAAGNTSASLSQAVSVVTGLPGAPTVNVVAGDNRINAAEAAAPITVSGTADGGTTVTLGWGSLSSRSVTAAADGSWSVVYSIADIAALAQGANLLTVTARDAAGNSRSTVPPPSITKDTVVPTQVVTITSATDDQAPVTGTVAAGGTTNDQSPIINGTVSAALASGETLHLFRNGVDLTPAGVTFSGTSWSVTDTSGSLASNTTYAYTARIIDAAGNQGSFSSPFSITIDFTPPPAPTIAAVTGDDIVSAAERAAGVSVTGSADPGSTVAVTWGATTLTGVASGAGAYSIAFSSAQIPSGLGSSAMSATASDASGNVSSAASRTVTIQGAPATQTATISTITDDFAPLTGAVATGGRTNDGTPALSGTVSAALSAGQTLHVLRNGTDVGTATVTSTSWTFTDNTDGFVNGTTYSYTAQVQAAAGNGPVGTAYSMVFDNAAPAAPVIAVIAGDDVISAAERTAGVTVTGTAEAGSSVAVTWNGFTRTATATGGNYSVAFVAAEIPASGASSVTARATDAAGNVSTQASHDVTSVAPASQTVVISAITDDFAPVTGTIATGGSTNDGTPTLSGTLSAALTAGQTLHVLRNGVDIGNASATATSWTFTDNTDGFVSGTTYSYTARVQDSGGNGTPSAAYSMVFDNTAPAVPTIGVVAGNDIVDFGEKTAGVTVGGSAATGSIVSVTWGATTLTSTAAGGTYSVTFSSAQVPADGASVNISAVAADGAGNASSAVNHPVQIATTLTFAGGGGAETLTLTPTDAVNLTNPASQVSGGGGTDVFSFGSGTISLNLTAIANTSVTSFERFDITGNAANTLTLNTADVLATGGQNLFTGAAWGGLTASNQVQVVIDGNAGDTVVASGGWTLDAAHAAVSNGGQTYATYNGLSSGLAVQLLIDTSITRTIS